ncbi:MAG: hypothetical protein M5U26_08040 [Planctomycetota bacterium]|nr:hypothetical protein [Planctomycetota bacterium]
MGTSQQHKLEFVADRETALVRLILDGQEVWCTSMQYCDEVQWFCFGVPAKGLERLLVRYRLSAGGVENFAVWPDPDLVLLKRFGLAEQAHSGYFAVRKPVRSWPWRKFLLDLGAFWGQGPRFNLSHLLVVVLLYGMTMTWAAISTGIMNEIEPNDLNAKYYAQRAMKYFMSYGMAWFLALPVFAAAGLGFALRNPQAPDSERGRMLVQRLAFGLVAGFALAHILYQNM